MKGTPVRVKQNSDINLVKGFYNVEKLITIIYTFLNGIQGNKKYEGKEAKMKGNSQQKFSLAIQETKHVDTLKALYQLGEEFEGFYNDSSSGNAYSDFTAYYNGGLVSAC